MKLIVISRPDFFSGEAEALNALLHNGLERLHLRKPKAKREELEALIRCIPKAYRKRVVLHDYHDLAIKYDLGGIHLNQRNPLPPEGYEGILSCSCHSLEEVKYCKTKYSYVFLSPIYDSISKTGYHSPFNLNDLHAAKDLIDHQVIALGGINESRVEELQNLGFGGVAILGDIWNKEGTDFVAHFRHLMRKIYKSVPIVLSIAGSDPSGGAGIQADLKSASAFGVFAATAITAVTVQNTRGVWSVHPLPPQVVSSQIQAVLDDLSVHAIKIGMVYNKATVLSIVTALQKYSGPIIYDPVLISTSGHKLMSPDVLQTISQELIPRCTLITPNLHEAQLLSNSSINSVKDMEWVAKSLSEQYKTAFLIKGGHLNGMEMCDVLYYNHQFYHYASPKINSQNLHGTGCTLSSAIASTLSLKNPLEEAIRLAKDYVSQAIAEASDLNIGHGQGPLWHFFT